MTGSRPNLHKMVYRSTGEPASRVCSRSRSRSKVTWYAHFLGFLEWATPSLTVWFAFLTCIWPWIWRSCRWNVDGKFGVRKLESWGCHTVKKPWSYVEPYGHSLRVSQTDGRTDGRTGRFTITKTTLCWEISKPTNPAQCCPGESGARVRMRNSCKELRALPPADNCTESDTGA